MGNTLIAGASGLVGSSIVRQFQARESDVLAPTRDELDYLDVSATRTYIKRNDVDRIFIAAARVGGILENSRYQFQQFLVNSQIQNSLMHAAFELRVPRLIFLSSSCVYPSSLKSSIREADLLSGPFEKTNEGYAAAKVGGMIAVKAARETKGLDWITLMPCSLFGPGDNYDRQRSHLIPSMLSRTYEAKRQGLGQVTHWGSGNPRREFMFIDDFAEICIKVAETYSDSEHLNIGPGVDHSISEIASCIAECVDYSGNIAWDTSKPDGVFQKRLNIDKLKRLYDWRPAVPFEEGLKRQFDDFLTNEGTQATAEF